ncbi:GNAT family N-acetyltransferase [Tardiphaga sp.]|uniref:GNAT family N-acetyltransferase n=1 Tax=Tardiphaga sp. TaxID=1926292 RepID=UPI0025DF6F56|nr:GNAT family N-acetyltransferase [Tardiphaga sp.]
MTVQILPIAASHIPGFGRALDVVAREKRYRSFLEGPPPEAVRAFVLDNIEHGHPQFVAMAGDEKLVGWCDARPNSKPIYAHSATLGMGLLPEFRGRGIGTRLIRSTLDAARVKGLYRIELTVREANASAIALYRKVGFLTEGMRMDAVCVDGSYENVLFMALLL